MSAFGQWFEEDYGDTSDVSESVLFMMQRSWNAALAHAAKVCREQDKLGNFDPEACAQAIEHEMSGN